MKNREISDLNITLLEGNHYINNINNGVYASSISLAYLPNLIVRNETIQNDI